MIIKPGEAVLPESFEFHDVMGHGPFRVGEVLPWKGVEFVVGKLSANANGNFLVVLAPKGLTASQVKRMIGRKGKGAAKQWKKDSQDAQRVIESRGLSRSGLGNMPLRTT